ncbi:MAE_28990/MAE_18760 family HEPN-like nuclease [Mitsuaria sp. 7]|uniref:MAE_28990/MAE_18760 family HEPN-like nuclease n=1 Tax=Mitsuaria sp. 7 TaxID=1658665 RepID=UPI000AEBC4C4|nr:MAE_28990/MAE_18760 family HEPN-like nuclease [Mitsuaria sp. 7]
MKIRTSAELMTHLQSDLAWRLAEIRELQACVTSARRNRVDVHIRAGVAMLYAHWEGFVKGAANAYVAHLAHRGDRNRDLKDCFVALSMRTLLAPLAETGTANAAIAAVAFLRAQQDQATRLSKASIGTNSNLNSKVFKNIAEWLDIDHRPYSTRFSTLDEVLLANRNAIAHGEHLFIDIVRFQTLVEEVVEMLHWFKTDIENAVAQKAFLTAVPSGVATSTVAAPTASGREPPSAT